MSAGADAVGPACSSDTSSKKRMCESPASWRITSSTPGACTPRSGTITSRPPRQRTVAQSGRAETWKPARSRAPTHSSHATAGIDIRVECSEARAQPEAWPDGVCVIHACCGQSSEFTRRPACHSAQRVRCDLHHWPTTWGSPNVRFPPAGWRGSAARLARRTSAAVQERERERESLRTSTVASIARVAVQPRAHAMGADPSDGACDGARQNDTAAGQGRGPGTRGSLAGRRSSTRGRPPRFSGQPSPASGARPTLSRCTCRLEAQARDDPETLERALFARLPRQRRGQSSAPSRRRQDPTMQRQRVSCVVVLAIECGSLSLDDS